MPNNSLSRLRAVRRELVALALLVPLAIVLGLVLTRFPKVETTPRVAATTTGAPLPSDSPLPRPTAASPVAPKAQSVALEIHGPFGTRTYALRVDGELSVADLLAHAAREKLLSLETKDYGGSLGIFVEGINGVRSDPRQQRYWTLYVNGERSPVGASSARVRPGDTVRWSYEHLREQ